jgi:hypothetical protein
MGLRKTTKTQNRIVRLRANAVVFVDIVVLAVAAATTTAALCDTFAISQVKVGSTDVTMLS